MSTIERDTEIFDRAVQRSQEWLDDVCDALGTDDERYAYRLLKAYLRVLRDSLPISDAAAVAAQLPHLLRGLFYEDWDGSAPEPRQEGDLPLVARLADEAKLDSMAEAGQAVAALSQLFARRIHAWPVLARGDHAQTYTLIEAEP